MGLQPAGDANSDNLVDITDFGILHFAFGHMFPDPLFDPRVDWSGDQLIDIVDFALLRGNFGQVGNRPGKTAPPAVTTGSAVLELRPNGKGPANGATIHVGDRFTLDLWVNAQAGTRVVGQQSYLTFPASQLRLGGLMPGSGTVAKVTPDNGVLATTLQNGICNGPAACTIDGLGMAPGTLSFASGTLNPTPAAGAFRVGQVTVQATAPGQVRLHWQLAPADPANRNSKVVTDYAVPTSGSGKFVDYVLNVLPAGK